MDIRINKRLRNRWTILDALHFHGPLQRSELSRRFEIRKNSVSSLADELLECGMLLETEPGAIRSPLALNPDNYFAVATMLHGNEAVGARVYLDGQLQRQTALPLAGRTPEVVAATLTSLCEQLLGSDHAYALGIGLTSAGVVDQGAGVIRLETKSFGWREVAWQQPFSRKFALPVLVDHEVRCQLWDQAWFGRLLLQAGNLYYLAIVEGVGAASIVHGRRVVGDHCSAGEIGHVRYGDEGRICNCGRLDCLETYCSFPAIERELHARRENLSSGLPTKNQALTSVLNQVTARLARALAAVMASFDPQVVLIGCLNDSYSAILAESLQRHLRDELRGLPVDQLIVQPIGQLQQATLRGAGALVMEKAFRTGSFQA